MSRVIVGVFEADLSASLPKLQRILDFLSLRNLASNELFFIYYKRVKFMKKFFVLIIFLLSSVLIFAEGTKEEYLSGKIIELVSEEKSDEEEKQASL